MNDDVNVSINNMHFFNRKILKKMYVKNQNMIQKNADFTIIKWHSLFIVKVVKTFEWQVSL